MSDGFNNLQEYLTGTDPSDSAVSPLPDFGDAPDPTYISLEANNGASHLLFNNEWLGDMVNGESNSTQIETDLFDDGVIFKGVMPFVLATMLAIIIIYFFPPLATWLPSLK